MSDISEHEIFKYNLSKLEFPGSHMFVGMTGSGKTTIVKWLLYYYAKKGMFHRIYVFCPTGLIEKKGNYPDFFDKNVIFSDPDKYELIFDKILEYQKKNPTRRILLLYDDCIGSVSFGKDFFTKVAISGRHFNISSFIITQYLNKVPPVIRTNCFTYFVFKTQAQNIETLQDFNSEYREKKDFRDKVFEHIQKDYHCVRINISSGIKKQTMFFQALPMNKPFRIEQ